MDWKGLKMEWKKLTMKLNSWGFGWCPECGVLGDTIEEKTFMGLGGLPPRKRCPKCKIDYN